MVTVEKGSGVFDTVTGHELISKKDFRVKSVAFKLGWCYYEVKGKLYRTRQSNIKERENV